MPPAQRKRPVVAAVEASDDDDFTYTSVAGDTITLPSLKHAFKDAGEMRRMRKASPLEVVFYVIERDLDEDALAAFDKIPLDEMRDRFVPEWGKHSGVNLGESSAS